MLLDKVFGGFFKSPKATPVIILFSVLIRVISILVVAETDRDTLILAVQSKSLLDGNGLSVPKYYCDEINNPVFDFTPTWPAGYPLLLSPFLKIFNYDLFWAATSLELITCIFFIFLIRRIAVDLRLSLVAINILTIIAGCFNYEFIILNLPTDSPAFVIFLLGLFLLLKAVQNENFSAAKLLLVSFLLFLPCLFRYSYPPLSFAAFAGVAFTGWYLKKRVLIKKGIIGLTFFSILIIGFFFLSKKLTGTSSYIVDVGRGVFPKQLLDWAPIGPAAFIEPVFTTSQLMRITHQSVQQTKLILEIISDFMIAGLLFVFIYLFFWKRFFKSLDPFKWFLMIGFFISIATFISLGYLTLTYKPQPGWGNYLGEHRYFVFVTLYLQIAFIGWVFLYPSWKKSILKKLIVFAFSLLLFIEITHSIYFNTKFILNFNKNRSVSFKDPDYVYFARLCKDLIQDNPDTEILVASDNDEYFRLMASYLGQKGIYDGLNLLNSVPEVKKNTILILALYDNQIPTYDSFLLLHNAQLIKNINHANFYRINLYPK